MLIDKTWTYISGPLMFHIKDSNNILKAVTNHSNQNRPTLKLSYFISGTYKENTEQNISNKLNFFYFKLLFTLGVIQGINYLDVVRLCKKNVWCVWDVFHLLWSQGMDFVSHHMVTLCEVRQSTFSGIVS